MTEHPQAVPADGGRGPVDIAQKFGRFTEHWSPKIIAEANGWQSKPREGERRVRLAPA